MARQVLAADGTIITLERYAQLSGSVGDPVRTIQMVIEAEADPDGVNGNWVACGDHGPGATTTNNGLTFTPPVVVAPALTQYATKRAFQNRFPKTADGISTKYDAVTLLLTDDGYAASLGVTGAAMYSLRMLIMAGKNRLDASPFVNLAPNADGSPTEAEAFTALLTQASIPVDLRLSAADRTAMLSTPLADSERYAG